MIKEIRYWNKHMISRSLEKADHSRISLLNCIGNSNKRPGRYTCGCIFHTSGRGSEWKVTFVYRKLVQLAIAAWKAN